MLPIMKSDTFNIVPIISFELKRNHFLKGFLKTLGAGAIVYKTNEQMQVDGKGTTAANKRFGLSLGIGIAAGMPDYIKAFKNKKDPQIIYSLYNKDKLLVSRQVVKWSRKAKPVTAIAQEDGFLQVSFINGSKQIENAGDLYIDIKQTSEKSQIDSEGITNTGGGQEQLPPEEPIYVITIDGIQ